MGKQRAIKLNLNRTFVEKDFPSDVGQLKAGKHDKVAFTPACVFSEEKTKFMGFIPRFWKGARNLIFFVDGAKNAMKFSKVTDKMMPFWTKKEADEYIKKQIAKARLKFKPLTWGQVILLAVLLIVVIIMQVISMVQRPF